jgi:hypothetical protein
VSAKIRFCLLLVACVWPLSSYAQQGDRSIYFHTTYREIAPEHDAAYRSYLTEVIKPLFAEEVSNGRLYAWYVYRTRYGSSQESYNYIFARVSDRLSAVEQPFETDFQTAVRNVHGNSMDEGIRKAEWMARVVKTGLWEQSSISVLQSRNAPARWASVSLYRNKNERDIARDLLLQNVVAQFQLGRMNRGIASGWAYFSRRLPFDSPDSFDSGEITYYDEFDQILGAGIGQSIWEEVRQDQSNLSDNLDRLRETRTLVSRELWELVEFVR